MKSQSRWARTGKIILIILAFYIPLSIYFEFFFPHGEGIRILQFINPFQIGLSLTLGYFVSMFLNLVKKRFLATGVLFIFWGLVCFWIGMVTEEWQYLGIVLVIVGVVIIMAPLLIRSRTPAY
jgi:hypothetical protein